MKTLITFKIKLFVIYLIIQSSSISITGTNQDADAPSSSIGSSLSSTVAPCVQLNTTSQGEKEGGSGNERIGDETGNRIVHGVTAGAGEIPYQVSIRYLGVHDCGGAIYTPDVVITAAHCIRHPKRLSRYLVVAGRMSINGVGKWEQERAVCGVTIHPKFNDFIHYNDIALLHICGPFSFNSYVRPVGSIHTKKTVDIGDILQVSDWGKLSNNGVAAMYLRKALVRPRLSSSCATIICKASPFDEDIMLCAGAGGDDTDACQGYSGGPLILLPKDITRQGNVSLHILVGLVSWGIGCGHLGVPGIYTNVGSYSGWIKDNSSPQPFNTRLTKYLLLAQFFICLRFTCNSGFFCILLSR